MLRHALHTAHAGPLPAALLVRGLRDELRDLDRAGVLVDGDEGDDTAAYEQLTEWLEGLARYADVSVMRLAGQQADTSLNNGFNYPAADEVRRQFLDQLVHPAVSPDGFRGRYYLLGAGQAFLLDRVMPDWKTRALTEKSALEELLQEAIP